MVKLKRVQTQGVASQLGLLRFAEDMDKGLRIDPLALIILCFGFAGLMIALHLFVL